MSLTAAVKARAAELGFDIVGITPLAPPAHAAEFAAWLAQGFHGEMAYLPAREALRKDPALLAPGARSVIALATRYDAGPPPAAWADPAHGRIARYAWAPDYHDVIKPRLYELDAYIREQSGRTVPGKACVDTAPLLERDLAMVAGLGFIGRNTCLIAPGVGSWLLLAALLVPEELEYDENPLVAAGEAPGEVWQLQTGAGTCGSCVRCLVACPTRAFAGPHRLDARRCISYLTIELRGPIPRDLRPLMGNWVFGCDVCQEVCPYNRDAAKDGLRPEEERAAPRLLDLLALDEASFRARYRRSPILRTKRRGLVRNACVAAGNWGDPAVVPALTLLLADPETLVRGHAAWALGRIDDGEARQALEHAYSSESDEWVHTELTAALEGRK